MLGEASRTHRSEGKGGIAPEKLLVLRFGVNIFNKVLEALDLVVVAVRMTKKEAWNC